MSSGRLFQIFGPTEPNERSPTVTRRDGRTSRWLIRQECINIVCTLFTSHDCDETSRSWVTTVALLTSWLAENAEGKGVWTLCYSPTYISQTRDQQRFTISKVAADWHEAMVPQRIMWPSITRANGQLDPRCSQQTHHSRPAEGRWAAELAWETRKRVSGWRVNR